MMDYIYYFLGYSNEAVAILSTLCQSCLNLDLFLNPWAERNTWGKLFVANRDCIQIYVDFVTNHPISRMLPLDDPKLYRKTMFNFFIQQNELYNTLCQKEFGIELPVINIYPNNDFRGLFDFFKGKYDYLYAKEGEVIVESLCKAYHDVNLHLDAWAERKTWGRLFLANSDLVNTYVDFVENHPISHIRVSEDSKLYKEMFANLLVQRTELYNRLCREEFVRLIMSESDFNADIDKECRALFDVFKANDENRFRLMNRCFVAGAIVLM